MFSWIIRWWFRSCFLVFDDSRACNLVAIFSRGGEVFNSGLFVCLMITLFVLNCVLFYDKS